MIRRHADIVDRTAWVLPKARLDAFRRGGAIVTEERRTTIDSRESVETVNDDRARLLGLARVTTLDVPRQQRSDDQVRIATTLTTRNHEIGSSSPLEVAEAAAADLPMARVTLGSRWTTKESVTTALGSGTITVEHVVSAIDDGLVQVDVTGAGTITGKEYNLPKLLPGSIRLRGSAWFDLSLGLFTRESYAIRNTLEKPAGAERIGFDETETVDITTDPGT